jgi:hypothetical protein
MSYAAIAELLNGADKDDEIRVVVLHGAEIPSPQATI